MKADVWITNYRPFILGGDVHASIVCGVEVLGPFDLGKGYQGWLLATPGGKTFVAETETGAIVGGSLDGVRADVAAADEAVMKRQIENAKKMRQRAYRGNQEEFWKRLEKGR